MSDEVDILRYRNSELEVAMRRLTAEMDAKQCRQCADFEERLSRACDTLVNYQAGYRDQCEKLAEARAEIEAWKLASGLEGSSGDPDEVTPATAQAWWEGVERQRDGARAVIDKLYEGVWVRCTSYHDERDYNATYLDDEYGHPFTVQLFAGDDPGDYEHEHGKPYQFRVKVPIEIGKPA